MYCCASISIPSTPAAICLLISCYNYFRTIISESTLNLISHPHFHNFTRVEVYYTLICTSMFQLYTGVNREMSYKFTSDKYKFLEHSEITTSQAQPFWSTSTLTSTSVRMPVIQNCKFIDNGYCHTY